MTIPVSVIMSAITAVLKYRGRVDTILSLNETTKGLPFRLPPAPKREDRSQFLRQMWVFFESPTGLAILHSRDRVTDFADVKAAVTNDLNPPAAKLNRCYTLYFEAADIPATLLASEGAGPGDLRALASSGPNTEMRLAYYVVESQRLSRNPVFARLALATVDTALEFLGENASSFIANPKTRVLVESVISEFAVKQDFDDFSIRTIYQSLLGSALFAALDNPDSLPNEAALKALFGALNDVRAAGRAEAGDAAGDKARADEFFARLITAEGFKDLTSSLFRQVASDPSFLSSDKAAKDVITATLNAFADGFPEILDGDKTAIFGVIEAGLAAGAQNVEGVLKGRIGDRPLITAVATAVAGSIGERAAANEFFRELGTGRIFAGIYQVALGAVASNPRALASTTALPPFATDLVTNLAQVLSDTPLKESFERETLRDIVSQSLVVLSDHPDLVARNNRFAATVVSAAFEAAGQAVGDGLQRDDVIAITDAALKSATNNLALVEMDERFRSVLVTVGGALGAEGVRPLLTRAGRKEALTASIRAVAANPAVWAGFDEADILQPLTVGIIDGLISDPTKLLSGPAMVEALRKSLTAVARRGGVLLAGDAVGHDELKNLLTLSLAAAEAEVGTSIDGENLPDFLERIILSYLAAPFTLAEGGSETFDSFIRGVIAQLDPAGADLP
ncbi:hypothetical protein [Denitrobaculum tricleocarpae]|uniref:Uncharacterized protein n=1 Tax=Denitrobaculum tricleocarpae TaxID=2591009 RepID=A0A545TXD5_9PROT|nr:hypothetical protein [Denitrobaculum tricleocarpae]TQV81860.1 hypothetical protein FKG95_06370 [Denitrobaculum tricleocarpae]